MAFIKEKIPEQYWDKLKQLGFDENIYYASWLADYKRSIFSWLIFLEEHDRDDYTMYWVILWKERKIIVRELVVDSSIRSVWNEDVLLKKGLAIIDIVEIVAYGVLPEEKINCYQLLWKLHKQGIRTMLSSLEIWLNLNLMEDKLWLLLKKIFPSNIGIN
jgi:hypothetical protein